MADIESAIFDIVAQQAKVERSSLKHDTELSSIELDSIDILEIIFDIEEEFNISILYNANQVPGEGGGIQDGGRCNRFHQDPDKRGCADRVSEHGIHT